MYTSQLIERWKSYHHINRCILSYQQMTKFNIHDTNSQQIEFRRNVLQINNVHLWKAHSKYHTKRWNVESFSSNIRHKTRVLILALLFNIVLEILARAIRQVNEIKVMKTWKEIMIFKTFSDKILYMKNPKDSNKILLEFIKKFGKLQDKISTYKNEYHF